MNSRYTYYIWHEVWFNFKRIRGLPRLRCRGVSTPVSKSIGKELLSSWELRRGEEAGMAWTATKPNRVVIRKIAVPLLILLSKWDVRIIWCRKYISLGFLYGSGTIGDLESSFLWSCFYKGERIVKMWKRLMHFYTIPIPQFMVILQSCQSSDNEAQSIFAKVFRILK